MGDPESAALLSIAARSWSFRWQVEREAGVRFASFAERFASLGAPQVLIQLARRSAADEDLHTGLCAELATRLGERIDPTSPVRVPEIAPQALSDLERLSYEVVAACCIAETESVGTLTTLLASEMEPEVHSVVHAIARDEVQHARLGWAYLAWLGNSRNLSFLAPLVPPMLTPGADLFGPPADPNLEDQGLLRWGVLPFAQRRGVYASMLREVIFPGLTQVGVDPGPARAWLEARESAMSFSGA